MLFLEFQGKNLAELKKAWWGNEGRLANCSRIISVQWLTQNSNISFSEDSKNFILTVNL